MTTSSASRCSASSDTVRSVMSPAGTITQTARGGVSAATKSAIEPAPVAPSLGQLP